LDLFCPKCQSLKDEEEFYRNRNRPTGRAGWCKECWVLRRDQNRLAVYVVFTFGKGRSSFSQKQRAKFDQLSRSTNGLYLVQPGGKVFKWGQWRTQAFDDVFSFVQAQTQKGLEVVTV
jgi:hypothetical protein